MAGVLPEHWYTMLGKHLVAKKIIVGIQIAVNCMANGRRKGVESKRYREQYGDQCAKEALNFFFIIRFPPSPAAPERR